MSRYKLLLFIIFTTIIYAKPITIDKHTNMLDILSSSQVYIDKTRVLSIDDIQTKALQFKENNNSRLSYGYSPNFDVWIKFILQNNTNHNISKILEYENPLTTNIEFFDIKENISYKDGLFQIDQSRKTINPTFKISLKPQEKKTYYVKAASHITTLIINLNIYESESFYEKEIKHQFLLALFFGAMFVLGIYNLFIYFFTKDVSYLYYVFYIFGIVIHHAMYVGMAYIYLLSKDSIALFLSFAPFIVAFPIFAMGMFTKYFLQTKQYKVWDTILNILLVLIVCTTFIFVVTDIFDTYRNIFVFSLFFYLIILTMYGVIKRNRQAYFILGGWILIFIVLFLMLLSSSGIFNIYNYLPYYAEVLLVLEGIVFSIALADRIKQLQVEKNEVNKKLIVQQKDEKKRLEIQVAEQTKDIQEALDEKALLLKEINHRVKNNMQMIVSLLRLQSDKIDDQKIKEIFNTVQNRINAMSHLHELLYRQDNISHINAFTYFDVLSQEVRESFESDVDINFHIQTDLKIEQAIYCGLIVNELITNSFKYAFPNNKGNIDIKLFEDDGYYNLKVCDDGVGFDQSKYTDSLGMILVNTLATQQLRGDISFDCSSGVKVQLRWKDDV